MAIEGLVPEEEEEVVLSHHGLQGAEDVEAVQLHQQGAIAGWLGIVSIRADKRVGMLSPHLSIAIDQDQQGEGERDHTCLMSVNMGVKMPPCSEYVMVTCRLAVKVKAVTFIRRP